MRGERGREMTLKVYPAAVIGLGLALALGVAGLALRRFEIDVWVSPGGESLEEPVMPEPQSAVERDRSSSAPASPKPSVAASPAASPAAAPSGAIAGNFRVSNRTEHPIRLALLSRQGATASPIEPVHWDFVPQEGSSKGLILSLPTTSLQLQKGDVVVAFAQDGSRRYWGPYVVGETPMPQWDAERSEWRLVVAP
jgi:hypothetical protein